MKLKLAKTVLFTLIASALAMGCNGGGSSGGTPTNPVTYTNTNLTPEAFVAEIVSLAKSGKIAASYADTTILKDVSAVDGYFVIYDGGRKQPVAVSNAYLNQKSGSDGSLSDAAVAYDSGYYSTTLHYYGYVYNKVLVTPSGTDQYGNPLFVDGYGVLFNNNSNTKDVSAKLYDKKQVELARTAQAISVTYQMNVESAIQVALLSEQIKQTKEVRALTSDDQTAIQNNVMSIAGISQEKLLHTIAEGVKGNDAAVTATFKEAAEHMGMPSGDALRHLVGEQLGTEL